MASVLKSLPVAWTIAAVSAVATAAQIRLADPPLRLPRSIGSLPDWLISAPNPWPLLTGLLAVLAAWRVAARWAATSARPGSGRPPAGRSQQSDPSFPCFLQGEFEEARRLGLFDDPIPEDPDPSSIQSWRLLPNFEAEVWRQKLARRVVLAEKLSAAFPENPAWPTIISDDLIRLGNIAMAKREWAEAERRFAAALRLAEKLAAADPACAEWQLCLGQTFGLLGELAIARGKESRGRRHFNDGHAVAERMAAAEPANMLYQYNLAASHHNLGKMALKARRLSEARRHIQISLPIFERSAAAYAANPQFQRDLAMCHAGLGRVAELEGNRTEAIRRLGTAEEMLSGVTERFPNYPNYARDLAIVRDERARVRKIDRQ